MKNKMYVYLKIQKNYEDLPDDLKSKLFEFQKIGI